MATVRELKDRMRRDLDDVVEPYFWTDDELLQYMNEAMDEVCMRTRSIRDSDTPEICEFRIRSGVSKYDLDPRILRVRRVYVEDMSMPLEEKQQDDLDKENVGWMKKTSELPCRYLTDMDSCWIKLNPTPTTENSPLVTMTVQRLQCEPLSLKHGHRSPELQIAHHYPMLEWAKFLAWSKHDAETLDPQAQQEAADLFAAEFGIRRTAEETRILQEHKSMRVRYHHI